MAQSRGVGLAPNAQRDATATGPYPPGTTETGDTRMESCIARMMLKGSSREAALAACNVTMLQRKRIAKR